jgi:chromosome segregation ATPase
MNDEMTTQPTLETLLARMDEWGANLTGELAEIKAGQEELRQSVDELRKGQADLRNGQEDLRKGQEDLHKGQGELRADMNSGLHRVKRQIQTLNDNFLEVQAEIRELNVQVEKLEAESLATK